MICSAKKLDMLSEIAGFAEHRRLESRDNDITEKREKVSRFMEEIGQERQINNFLEQEKNLTYLESAVYESEIGLDSKVNNLPNEEKSKVGSMEEACQESQIGRLNKEVVKDPHEEESRVEFIEKIREEGHINDISMNQENEVNIVSHEEENEKECLEEVHQESQIGKLNSEVNSALHEEESKVGFIEKIGDKGQINYISDNQENMVESMEEIGQERHINCTSQKHDDELRKRTISWEEALQREHGYRKKMEKFLLQCPDSFELLPVHTQEKTPNSHTVGMKRRASVCLGDGDCSETEIKDTLLHKQSNHVANHLSLHAKPCSSVLRKPVVTIISKQEGLISKTIQERMQHSLPREIFSQRATSQRVKKYLCYICQVQCPSPGILSKHQQGKSHRKKLELLIEQKKKSAGCEILWCHSCNVPCSGVVPMRQHLIGKRHQASMKMQNAGFSGNIDITLDATGTGSELMSSDLHQPECSVTSMKETGSDITVEATAHMVPNRRIRTSSWPNYL